MKFSKKEIIIGVLLLLTIAVFVIFEYGGFEMSDEPRASALLKGALSRTVASALLVAICVLCGQKDMFYKFEKPAAKAILWCVPCLLVALANFPFAALFSGKAVLERFDLIGLFVFQCLAIGIMEELLFRGLFQPMIIDTMKITDRPKLYGVLLCSVLFGLWHLTNLLSGANVGYTMLQVGYSFLIGAMLSAVRLRTGNILPCIFLHALFDFGGAIVTTLGSGPFQDAWFWTLTAVCGVFCLVHVAAYLLKIDYKDQANKKESK